MAGRRELQCRGFIETKTCEKSRERLKQLLELTARDIDDRLEALVGRSAITPIQTFRLWRRLRIEISGSLGPIIRTFASTSVLALRSKGNANGCG